MNDQTAQFMPFHALNQFMRSDYRMDVVRRALLALPNLPQSFQTDIERSTKKWVHVAGFRNSVKAPVAMRIRPTAGAFEKSPELVAAIVSAWAASEPDLRSQVYDLLTGRGWIVLPADADRTQLPGFLPKWPHGEDFDVLNAAFKEKYPEAKAEEDDVSLMVVWLSGRLPFMTEEEAQPPAETE